MSSDYSPRSGGRRRRRGGRGNQGGAPQSGGRSGTFNKDSAPRGEKPKAASTGGLWGKIKSLFGLGAKKDARSSEPRAPRSEHPTLRRAEEQKQREPRGERSERGERSRQPREPREPRGDREPRAEREPRAPREPREPREPQKTELEEANPDAVTIPRLYIGNLAYDTAESDVFDLFSKVGSVRNVELVMDRRSNRSKGFGFIEMADLEVAKKAVVTLHRSEFMGRQLIVSGAKSERRIESAPVTQELPPIE